MRLSRVAVLVAVLVGSYLAASVALGGPDYGPPVGVAFLDADGGRTPQRGTAAGAAFVAPVTAIVGTTAGSARSCFGVTSADGGTATLSIAPGSPCRMNCTSSACMATTAVTTCSASATMVPDGLRWNERQPEAFMGNTVTPTPDAGASDAQVYYLGAESSAGCCACTPLQ